MASDKKVVSMKVEVVPVVEPGDNSYLKKAIKYLMGRSLDQEKGQLNYKQNIQA